MSLSINHTWAARGVISSIISLPSSSFKGFCTHIVASRVADAVNDRLVGCRPIDRTDDLETGVIDMRCPN